jgi:predicted NBD/HSP70 family sugar kinase
VTVDGQPLIGSAGYAGEIGHMIVNPGGAACACGSNGCWETEIGERAMLVRAGRPATGGRAAVDELIAAALAGEPAAADSVAQVGDWLGIGIASLINVFNPTLVVLGGVLGRIHPLVAPQLEAVLERRALPASRELVRVTPGALGVNAPIIGAAELAFEPMLADPAARLGTPPGARPELATA